VERFELRKDGSLHFSHPQNQHDDVWWATALAISCGVKLAPDPLLAVIPRRVNKLEQIRKKLNKHKVLGVTR